MTGKVMATAAAALLWGTAGLGADGLPPLADYLGSEGCRVCHPQRYEDWQNSYHSSVIQDPRANPEAVLGDFSQEGIGFSPSEIEFTVGGHWYQRYAVRRNGDLFVLPKVWSVASHRWETQDEWSWQRKPYEVYCMGCHATRYDPGTRTMVEHRVGCEACHGPGRDHGQSGGREPIVNPSHWDEDERDLLCASCHVRGQDPTGTYYFAVGYVPGRELANHYRPHRIPDDLSPRQAFLEEFRRWAARLGDGPPPTCDVCGIDRDRPAPSAKTVSAGCLECHRFGEDYALHTRHPGNLELQCLDCHREVSVARPLAAAADVHAPEFFQVHGDRAFESDVAGACQTCHAEMPVGRVFRTLLEWNHSGHQAVD